MGRHRWSLFSLCSLFACFVLWDRVSHDVVGFPFSFDAFDDIFDHQHHHHEEEEVEHEDFYETLELTMDATDKQIKQAYRKLSLKYHPDKNPNNAEAQQKFQKIAYAYEVLSNQEKRQIYDLEGMQGLKRQEQGGGEQASSPFDMFFGGGGGGKKRGADKNVDISVTLEDLYRGAELKKPIKRNVVCRKCRGTGAKDGKMKTCQKCHGKGVIYVQQQMGIGFNVQMQKPCPKCGGAGKSFKTKCPYCKGKKLAKDEKEFNVQIEKGMPSDHKIVFERQSDQKPGILPGNVIFRVVQKPHKRFTRDGNDLHYTLKISLEEALLGYQTSIKHLDDRQLPISSNKVIKPFEIHSHEDEGMPHHNYPSQHGALHVTHHIVFPKSLTKEQKKLVKSILPE